METGTPARADGEMLSVGNLLSGAALQLERRQTGTSAQLTRSDGVSPNSGFGTGEGTVRFRAIQTRIRSGEKDAVSRQVPERERSQSDGSSRRSKRSFRASVLLTICRPLRLVFCLSAAQEEACSPRRARWRRFPAPMTSA